MSNHRGFTLVELLVVVMIVGILTAIAVPRYMTHIARTDDQNERIKLLVIRDAIERYSIEHDREFPPAETETEFKDSLAPYLTGDFPATAIDFDNDIQKDGISIDREVGPISADAVPVNGWKYNPSTGEFIINSEKRTALEPTFTYADW